MSKIADFLGQCFEFVHSGIFYVIPYKNISYGLAIILFTAIIRVILLPLNINQTKSQMKMQKIQPDVKKLQTKYKNDSQKLNEEMMKLYKERGVNPVGGCLPLIVQMPILFALFYVFRDLKGISGVSFLWIKDLSKADLLYILPILSGITQYISTSMMNPKGDDSQSKQAGSMNIAMSIFITVMSWKFQASLVLYWVINNVFQILQTLFMKRHTNET